MNGLSNNSPLKCVQIHQYLGVQQRAWSIHTSQFGTGFVFKSAQKSWCPVTAVFCNSCVYSAEYQHKQMGLKNCFIQIFYVLYLKLNS